MMDCLYAKCQPIITDCVMGELEKVNHTPSKTLHERNVSMRIRLNSVDIIS